MPELGSVGHFSMLIRRFRLFSQTFLFFIAAELLRTVEVLVGGSSRPLHGDTVSHSRTLFLRSLLTTTNLYAIINLSYRNFPHMIACFGKTAAFCEPI